jgi:hypothetical protein
MTRHWVFAGMLTLLFSGTATAGLCEAPFMHEGGQTQLTGSGDIRLGADLAFSEVSKDGDSCQARVQGVATYGLGGLPSGKANLDYLMTVKGGQATFSRRNAQGGVEPVNGKFDLRMLGLFAYGEPITRSGQTFPALKFQINVDRKAVQADPIVVRTGEKTVGSRQTISTTAGDHACWPIRYTRIIDPTRATFNGLTLPIPGMTSEVTDWFCPELSMVMKQESEQSGATSIVEVTKLR